MVALKTLVFSILVPGTVTVIIPWLMLQGTGGRVLPILTLWVVGLLPLLLGVGLSVWCAEHSQITWKRHTRTHRRASRLRTNPNRETTLRMRTSLTLGMTGRMAACVEGGSQNWGLDERRVVWGKRFRRQ